MKEKRILNLALLHLIVLIFGFTGILGKLVSLESGPLVLLRMLIAGAVLFAYMFVRKKILVPPRKWLIRIALIGLVIAGHWILFFEAINQSNVSVTLATMASTTLFVALFTPLIGEHSFKWYELWLGLAVIFGLVLIFGFAGDYWLGIVLALGSSALAAVFTLINAEFIRHVDAYRITLWEMLFGGVGVACYLAVRGYDFAAITTIGADDWLWVMLLAVLATAFAFVVSVEVMKVISPFTVAISVNLEPIYSIILALLIFGEEERMDWGFYVGSSVIVGSILANAVLKKRLKESRVSE